MKILIINENRHNSTGGIEKYTNQLINILSKNGHDVFEYAFNLNPERIDLYKHNDLCKPLNLTQKTEHPLSLKQKRNLITRCVKEIKSIWQEYDLIINQTANIKWSKEIYKSPKWIYVQHFCPNFYKQKYIAGSFLRPIIYFGMWMTGIKNPFKNFKNLVFFSEEDKKALNARTNSYVIIPLAAYSKKQILENKKNIKVVPENNYLFFGRIDNLQKNIKYIANLFESNQLDIDFYGQGQIELLDNKDYCHYKGIIKQDEIPNIISSYKFNVLLSKYEGFPFSIVECLSNGIPTISSMNCASSKTLTNNKGFILSKKDKNKIIDINKLDKKQYLELRQNCLDYALENLTLEAFENNWIQFINSLSSNSK